MGCKQSVPQQRVCDLCKRGLKKDNHLFYNYTYKDTEYKMCVTCLCEGFLGELERMERAER